MRSWFVRSLRMMRRCLVRSILERSMAAGSIKTVAVAATAAAITVICLQGASDPMAELKASAAAFESKNYTATLSAVEGLAKRLPKLADYSAWLKASAQ